MNASYECKCIPFCHESIGIISPIYATFLFEFDSIGIWDHYILHNVHISYSIEAPFNALFWFVYVRLRIYIYNRLNLCRIEMFYDLRSTHESAYYLFCVKTIILHRIDGLPNTEKYNFRIESTECRLVGIQRIEHRFELWNGSILHFCYQLLNAELMESVLHILNFMESILLLRWSHRIELIETFEICSLKSRII